MSKSNSIKNITLISFNFNYIYKFVQKLIKKCSLARINEVLKLKLNLNRRCTFNDKIIIY